MNIKQSNVACQQCPLRELPAFTGNTPQEIAFIQSLKRGERLVGAGTIVIEEHKQNSDLYTLLSGWAFRFRTLRDGRRQILNFLFPGDLIGLQKQLSDDATFGVETLTPVTLCLFQRDRLWDLFRQHPSLGYDITWLAAHEELIVNENLLTVGRRSAQERVAMLLMHLYKRAESVGLCENQTVPFPVTQQHIADALGLSLVHVNKTLRSLAKLGLHELSNNRLRIIQPTALQRLADYHALPMQRRPLI